MNASAHFDLEHYQTHTDQFIQSLVQDSAPTGNPLQLSRDSGDLKTWLRNASYLGAIQDLADGGDATGNDIRAGQQKLIQICVTNAANVFLLKAESDQALYEQVGTVIHLLYTCISVLFIAFH